MNRIPLDMYDDMPRAMRNYLKNYGWHFNSKAVKFACSLMKKKNNATGKLEKIESYTKEKVDELLVKYGIKLENAVGDDYVFAANMCLADYYKSSITDEQHLAMFVKDVVDDPDAGDGTIMRRWYAGMIAAGEVVDWEEML